MVHAISEGLLQDFSKIDVHSDRPDMLVGATPSIPLSLAEIERVAWTDPQILIPLHRPKQLLRETQVGISVQGTHFVKRLLLGRGGNSAWQEWHI